MDTDPLKSSSFARPKSTPPEIERRELEWWQTFAEAEERFAWVQTPSMQKILRGHYVDEILQLAGSSGSILELGCGVGWLSLALANAGATRVVGVDFSQAQINIANQRAKVAALDDHVRFVCTDGTSGNEQKQNYDCVVVHGFLHHLNQMEIERTIESIPRLLNSSGAFIVFEPVRYTKDCGVKCSPWQRRQEFLMRLATGGQRLGVRRMSKEEKNWRDILARRDWGKSPHGPSPKEMPFEPGELENYLAPYFKIERRRVCMAISHLVTQQWLLRGLSHPLSTRLLLPFIARLAAKWDRRLASQPNVIPGLWYFNMFVCRALPQS